MKKSHNVNFIDLHISVFWGAIGHLDASIDFVANNFHMYLGQKKHQRLGEYFGRVD